jgi:hypothetical protein
MLPGPVMTVFMYGRISGEPVNLIADCLVTNPANFLQARFWPTGKQ